MVASVADQLMSTSTHDFDSESAWPSARAFFYNVLKSSMDQLPQALQQCLSRRGEALPPEPELTDLRVSLWDAIKHDSMGDTREGAAIRAGIFAVTREESYDPAIALSLFSSFYFRAGLPESEFRKVFIATWPEPGA
jgi:hypothetical protein